MKPNVFISKDKDSNIVIDDQSIWKARKTDSVPLDSWNIVELKGGPDNGEEDTSHFIGNDFVSFGARISTTIQEYNEEKKTGKTLSGTEYELLGEPGLLGPDAIYLFNRVFGAAFRDGRVKFRY